MLCRRRVSDHFVVPQHPKLLGYVVGKESDPLPPGRVVVESGVLIGSFSTLTEHDHKGFPEGQRYLNNFVLYICSYSEPVLSCNVCGCLLGELFGDIEARHSVLSNRERGRLFNEVVLLDIDARESAAHVFITITR